MQQPCNLCQKQKNTSCLLKQLSASTHLFQTNQNELRMYAKWIQKWRKCFICHLLSHTLYTHVDITTSGEVFSQLNYSCRALPSCLDEDPWSASTLQTFFFQTFDKEQQQHTMIGRSSVYIGQQWLSLLLLTMCYEHSPVSYVAIGAFRPKVPGTF